MTIKKVISPILAFGLFIPGIALAIEPFNPHFIISDQAMQDTTAMTRTGVQAFLNEQNSYLAGYSAPDYFGRLKRASDIIYDSALKENINPKVLLTLLQKEQSLISDPTPSARQLDWATGYAVCDGCSLSDPKVVKHKGFGNQVNDAAEVFRWYYDNKDINGLIKKINTPITIDNTMVIPQSWATAFLYTYTPHLHGNENFYKIWNGWFEGSFFPNGTLFQSASGEYWLVQDGQKRLFKNKSTLLSRTDPTNAIKISDTDLAKYTTGNPIAFANYSLLKSGLTTYLLDYDTLRPFASDEVIKKIGYNPDEIITVAEADLNGYKIGNKIEGETVAPAGVIYQITDLNSYYLLKDSKFYPIVNSTIIKTNFPSLAIEKHKSNDLKKYPVANEPIIFADGTLLQADGKIYVMENNKKRRIQDLTALLAMGYKKENLISIDLITALGIPNGESFYIENNLDKKPNGVVMTEDNESMEIVQPSPLVQPVSDVEYTYDQNDVKDLFKTEVPAYLVVEYPSGKILAGKDVDTKRPLASLTKLVTAYVAIKQGYNFRETTTYYESRHSNYGNPLKLATGEQMKNDDLFNSLLILSMNKASRMIAQQKMTEDAFIKKMNEQIKIWGLKNTIFEDTSGLSENNLASARNLSKIFYEGLQIPEINAALSTKEYSLTKLSCITEKCTYTFPNTDHLMAETNPTFTVLAGKTGYTDEAQSVLVQLIQDNESNKQFIIVSVGNLDYAHRFDEPRRLSEWVVKNY